MTEKPTLTPVEYAFFPSKESPSFGMLFCVDGDGRHHTAVGDAGLVSMLSKAPDGLGEFEIGGEWLITDGWPDEWKDPKQRVASLQATLGEGG